MNTFTFTLLVAAVVSFWVLSRKETYADNTKGGSNKNGSESPKEVWYGKIAKLRARIVDEYAAQLSTADKALYKKLITDADASLGKKSIPPWVMGQSKYNMVRAGILTEAEVEQRYDLLTKQMAYLKTEMPKKMKCTPKLWQPDSFDPSKYKYILRQQSSNGSWTCPVNNKKAMKLGQPDQYIYHDTFCTWGDKENETRQCAAYSFVNGDSQPVPV